MLPGHQLTCARIIRTEKRMNAKVRTNAAKKQNSGNRPVSRMFSLNQSPIRSVSVVRRRRGKETRRSAAQTGGVHFCAAVPLQS